MTSPSPRQTLQARSWLAVVRAYQTCERQYARLLGHFDLTIAQFDVLSAIDELGDAATPARIAERLLVTKGNITGLLRRLGEQGLIVVSPNPSDGRSQRCRLAAGVSGRLARVRQAAAAFIACQLAPFSDDELLATMAQMERMRVELERLDVAGLVAAMPASRGQRRG